MSNTNPEEAGGVIPPAIQSVLISFWSLGLPSMPPGAQRMPREPRQALRPPEPQEQPHRGNQKQPWR